MATVEAKILVHIAEGKVTVRLTEAPPENWISFPAAFAVTHKGEELFFEDALALKGFDGVKVYEIVENYLDECNPDYLDHFFRAIFRRKDVLTEVGSLDKQLVVCSTFFIDLEGGEEMLGSRCISYPTLSIKRLFTYSEEELYAKSVVDFDIRILHLWPNYLNFTDTASLTVNRIAPGFNDILNYFIKLLCLKGYDLTDAEGQVFCRQLVLEYCYVARDIYAEQEYLESKNGVLFVVETPSGGEIQLGEECFLAPEVLFQPALIGMEGKGVVQKVFKLLNSSGPRDILLCGILGSQLRGVSERFEAEMSSLSNGPVTFTIVRSGSLDKGALNLNTGLINQTSG